MRIIIGILVALGALLLYSCNDQIETDRNYDFKLTTWYLKQGIKVGEVVEIRFTLTRERDYQGASYQIGYVQKSGDGVVFDKENRLLVSREFYALDGIPGLDKDDPKRQYFTLFYRATSDEQTDLTFIVIDDAGKEREMLVSFDVEE